MYEQQRRPSSRSKVRNPLRATQTAERARLQALNIAITPGPPGKKFAYKNGREEASTSRRRLRIFGRDDSTIAVCDRSGEHGMLIIDLDRNHDPSIDGVENFKRLCQKAKIELAPTLVIATPRGGMHFYYWQRSEGTVRNSAGKLGPGIDVRGAGGIGVLPPTPGYRILDGSPIRMLPSELHALMVSGAPKHQITQGGITKHNVGGILQTLSRAEEGQRNSTLHWALCRIAELPARKQHAAVWNTRLVAQELGLPDWEIDQTVASTLGANRG